jgi:hypothetical protein
MGDMSFNPTTPLWFYYKGVTYVPGEGATEAWTAVSAAPLYGEWTGSYGARLSDAQAMGVQDSATVRTFYHPTVLEKMRTVQVIVIKDTLTGAISGGVITPGPNVYELWGAPDDVKLAHREMEFKVRRYEAI